MEYKYWKWGNSGGGLVKTKRNERKKPTSIPLEFSLVDKNKREECCERISNREWITQRSINPFLSNNDYIEDLNNQQEFLIPKDSNIKDMS